MRTIIHDLNEENLSKFYFDSDDNIIDATKCKNSCIGCFSCWIKHPKKCIYNDNYSNMTDFLKDSEELVLISKCRYGCYSHYVKRVLERCIGYVQPYFTIRKGEMHHKVRYDKNIKIVVYFYGDMDDEDKLVINDLIESNADNLDTDLFKINYIENIEEIENVYID